MGGLPPRGREREMPTKAMKAHWLQILLAVADGPRHGTAIMEEVLERRGSVMVLDVARTGWT